MSTTTPPTSTAPQALDFLSVLGQNEDSQGAMNKAEHLYTLDRLAADPFSEGKEARKRALAVLTTAAEARGTLDHSRIQQIEAQYAAGTKAAETAYADSTKWTRVGINTLVPAIAKGVLKVVGDSGPWAVAMPLLQAGGVEWAKQFHDDIIFRKPHLPDPPPKDKHTFFELGEKDISYIVQVYLGKKYPTTDAEKEFVSKVKGQYLTIGPNGDLLEGRDPYPDPK